MIRDKFESIKCASRQTYCRRRRVNGDLTYQNIFWDKMSYGGSDWSFTKCYAMDVLLFQSRRVINTIHKLIDFLPLVLD